MKSNFSFSTCTVYKILSILYNINGLIPISSIMKLNHFSLIIFIIITNHNALNMLLNIYLQINFFFPFFRLFFGFSNKK